MQNKCRLYLACVSYPFLWTLNQFGPVKMKNNKCQIVQVNRNQLEIISGIQSDVIFRFSVLLTHFYGRRPFPYLVGALLSHHVLLLIVMTMTTMVTVMASATDAFPFDKYWPPMYWKQTPYGIRNRRCAPADCLILYFIIPVTLFTCARQIS